MKKILIIVGFLLLIQCVVYADTATVEVDEITINDVLMEVYSAYPPIRYNDNLFIPLSDEYLPGLSLKYREDAAGVYISSIDYVDTFKSASYGSHKKGDIIDIVPVYLPIHINGNLVLDSDDSIKCLKYGGILYMSVDNESVRNKLNWEVEYINSTCKIKIPENNYSRGAMKSNYDLELAPTEIIKLSQSCVKLISNNRDDSISFASGFYIGLGKIITSYDLIESATRIELENKAGFKSFIELSDDNIIGKNEELNLAIIDTGKYNNDFLEFGKEPLFLGQQVYLISSTVGYKNILTEGIISNIDDDEIQVTAITSIGSEGGAVLDKYGNVIGVVKNSISGDYNITFVTPISEYDAVRKSYEFTREESPYFKESKPVTPMKIKGKINDLGGIDLSWTNTGADYYNVYVSVNNSSFLLLKNKQHKYMDFEEYEELKWYSDYCVRLDYSEPGNTYKYKVSAVKDGIESDKSDSAKVELPEISVKDFESILESNFNKIKTVNNELEFFDFYLFRDGPNALEVFAVIDLENLFIKNAIDEENHALVNDVMENITHYLEYKSDYNVGYSIILYDSFSKKPRELEENKYLLGDTIDFNKETMRYDVFYPLYVSDNRRITNE